MYIIASCCFVANAQREDIRKADKGLFKKVDRQWNQNGIGAGGLLSVISALTFLFQTSAVPWSRCAASSRSLYLKWWLQQGLN